MPDNLDNKRIVLLGSGAVATHLGKALYGVGHHICQVYSPHMSHAITLASTIASEAIDNLSKLTREADIYIIAIKDDAITECITTIGSHSGIWVHTAGSVSMHVFKDLALQFGVFYPMQTFSKNKEVNFSELPICVEANDANAQHTLYTLAKSISNKVYFINEQQRRILHLSAVFACNFVNLMYSNAQSILEKNHIPFDLMRPLIAETAEKVLEHMPLEVQTGPAIRKDLKTLEKHRNLLKEDANLLEIYNTLSHQIIDLYK